MMRWTTLNPNERLLVVSPVNRYKIMGPGRVWLTPRKKILVRLYVGPKGQSFEFDEVRTSEDLAVKVKVQILYRADPELFSDTLLSRIPGLNEGGWQGILQWQTEYVLRMLMAHHPWRELKREDIQKRLERRLSQTLADRLKMVGLNVMAASLVKVGLPTGLQKTLTQAEKDNVEAKGRAAVLQNYLEIFGDNLPHVMPYIIQWEMMNTIHKNDPQILLTAAGLSQEGLTPFTKPPGPVYQLQLPVSPRRE